MEKRGGSEGTVRQGEGMGRQERKREKGRKTIEGTNERIR